MGGYAHKWGHMFGGVCHKNVTQRIGIGHGSGIVWAWGCVWEGSRDYGRLDRDSRSWY